MKICAVALICTVATVIIKQAKPEFAFAVRAIGIIIIMGVIIASLVPVFEYAGELLDTDGIDGKATLIFTSLGIGLVTYICSTVCRECGESGIGDLVDTAGGVAILLTSLPAIKELTDLITGLLSK